MTERMFASEYDGAFVEFVHDIFLAVISKLGSLTEHIVVVGGMVPSLLIDATDLKIDPHLGTNDVDLGIAVKGEDRSSYQAISDRLQELGFVRQGAGSIRWAKQDRHHLPILIDLLPVASEGAQQAVPELPERITRPLQLAFLDRQWVTIETKSVDNESIQVRVGVCGPGAFIVIKALTFDQRRLNKDAYDLYYVLHHYGQGVQDVAAHLAPLMQHPDAKEAFRILSYDFADPIGEGSAAVALFLYQQPDDNLQADVSGEVRQLLDAFGGPV